MCLCEPRDRPSLEEGVRGLRRQDKGPLHLVGNGGSSPGSPPGRLLTCRSHRYCTVQRGAGEGGLRPGEERGEEPQGGGERHMMTQVRGCTSGRVAQGCRLYFSALLSFLRVRMRGSCSFHFFFKHWRGGRWCRSCLPRRRRAPAGQAPRVPASPGGHLFPHMEVMSRSCKQGIARQEKDLGSESWKCFEKAKTKQKYSKSYSVSSELLELLAVSLHVFIFVCFQRLHLFSPLPDLLKKYQVNAKGHFQNSSELPKEESDPSLSPSREILGLHSGRRDCGYFTLIPL